MEKGEMEGRGLSESDQNILYVCMKFSKNDTIPHSFDFALGLLLCSACAYCGWLKLNV